MPFNRTAINVMFAKINKAEKEDEVEGCVNLGALRANLTTPAWAPLEDANSILSKVLLSIAWARIATKRAPYTRSFRVKVAWKFTRRSQLVTRTWSLISSRSVNSPPLTSLFSRKNSHQTTSTPTTVLNSLRFQIRKQLQSKSLRTSGLRRSTVPSLRYKTNSGLKKSSRSPTGSSTWLISARRSSLRLGVSASSETLSDCLLGLASFYLISSYFVLLERANQ